MYGIKYFTFTKYYKLWNANSADPVQTGPEGTVWSGSALLAVPLSYKKQLLKSKI